MALLFCCPVCGSNLRVPRSAAVATVACPGCREPIHVPRHTHPAEALHDTLLVLAGRLDETRFGVPEPVEVRDDGLVTPIWTEKGGRRGRYLVVVANESDGQIH